MSEIKLSFIVEPYRVGNLEFRQATSLRGVNYFEIVCIQDNPDYMNFEGYEFDPSTGRFRDIECPNIYKSIGCFTSKTTCYTIMTCQAIDDEPDWTTVGNRPFESGINQEDLLKVANYGYEVIHKLYSIRNEMNWEARELLENGISLDKVEEEED